MVDRREERLLEQIEDLQSELAECRANALSIKQTLEAEIDARKQAEAELQAQIILFDALLEVSIDTIEIIDPNDSHYRKWNAAVSKISGYSDEEIAGMDPVEDFIDEADKPQIYAAIERALAEGQAKVRSKTRLKDGSHKHIEYQMSIARDEEDTAQFLIVIGRDVSKQIQLEQALKESEMQYRELVENINEVIYSIDQDGIITYVSPAIESLLELSPEQVIGQSFADSILPEDMPQAMANADRILQGEILGVQRYRARTASGDVRWIQVSSLPVKDGKGIVGLRGVLTDITELKQAEEQLESAAMLAERQRLARDLHDSVTQTLYAIEVFSNAIQRALALGKTDNIKNNINEIQELSRSALADMRLLIFELQPEILDEKGLAAALRERLNLVEARAGFSTSYRVEGERSVPPSTESELYAIAKEALNNILKHSKADNVGVILELKEFRVCMTIFDDGIGFDTSNADQIAGIGLRSMQERVANCKGAFYLKSSEGHGTTVKVEVPI